MKPKLWVLSGPEKGARSLCFHFLFWMWLSFSMASPLQFYDTSKKPQRLGKLVPRVLANRQEPGTLLKLKRHNENNNNSNNYNCCHLMSTYCMPATSNVFIQPSKPLSEMMVTFCAPMGCGIQQRVKQLALGSSKGEFKSLSTHALCSKHPADECRDNSFQQMQPKAEGEGHVCDFICEQY